MWLFSYQIKRTNLKYEKQQSSYYLAKHFVRQSQSEPDKRWQPKPNQPKPTKTNPNQLTLTHINSTNPKQPKPSQTQSKPTHTNSNHPKPSQTIPHQQPPPQKKKTQTIPNHLTPKPNQTKPSIPRIDERGKDLFIPLLRSFHQDPQRSKGRQHSKQVPQTYHSYKERHFKRILSRDGYDGYS